MSLSRRRTAWRSWAMLAGCICFVTMINLGLIPMALHVGKRKLRKLARLARRGKSSDNNENKKKTDTSLTNRNVMDDAIDQPQILPKRRYPTAVFLNDTDRPTILYLTRPKKDNAEHPPSPSLSTSHRIRSILPHSHQYGGIIVSVHLPKAGGTSMEKNIPKLLNSSSSALNLTYLRSNYEGWDAIVSAMNDAVGKPSKTKTTRTWTQWFWGTKQVKNKAPIHERGQLLWVDLHTRMDSFMEVLPQLQEWREFANATCFDDDRDETKKKFKEDMSCKKKTIPFFAFSIVRDPVSWAISCFQHVCLKYGFRNSCNGLSDDERNQEGLLRAINPNPQCSFYTKGWHDLDQRIAYLPSAEECTSVVHAFHTTLDWVGTLEHYDETLAVLATVLGVPHDKIEQAFQGHRHESANHSRAAIALGKGLDMTSLANKTLDYLEQISWLDRILYEHVKASYKRDDLFSS